MKKDLAILLERANELEGEITAWRREIHRHPELSFKEHRTAQLVADALREMGIQVKTGVGKTGIVGTLGKGRPAIGIRADMDALVIQEATNAPYASEVPNVMHACGHDANTAIVLGLAKLLSQAEDRPDGEIRFLFQPSEETTDDEDKGGAVRMVEDGAVEGLDAVIALHVTSDYQPGHFEIIDGYPYASVCGYEAKIIGKGCPDAYPHQGLDPIFLLAQVINSIHGIKAIRIDPLQPSIISVSTVHGGDASNVTPNNVKIRGTIRSYGEETMEKLLKELERALSVAKILGGDFRLNLMRDGYSVRNNSELVAIMREVIGGMVGESHLLKTTPGMSGDDFGCLVQNIPGLYCHFGVQLKGEMRPHHSPTFDLDESALPLATAVLAGTVYHFLEKGKF
jgi:amidohydrolase